MNSGVVFTSYLAAAYKVRTIKAIPLSYGFDLLPAYADGYPIDTSLKGYLLSNVNFIRDLYSGRSFGLMNRHYLNKIYHLNHISTTDSVFIKDTIKIDMMSVLAELSVDTTGMDIGTFQNLDIDSVTTIFAGKVNKQGFDNARGLLLVRYNRDNGNIISKKYIREELYPVLYSNFMFLNNHIYFCTPWGYENNNYCIRKMTLDGEIVKEIRLDYTNTPIIKEYAPNGLSDDNISIIWFISDNDEIYFTGGLYKKEIDALNLQYKAYLAKYNTEGQLLYEKLWQYKEGVSTYSKNILVRGDAIYIYAQAGGNLIYDSTDVNYEYSESVFYKFKDTTTAIHAPSVLSSSLLYPNPTSDNHTTLTLDLQVPSNIKIVLNDMLGRELQQIYEGLADAGTFTKSFSTQGLTRGVYYLKILIGGDIKIEKVVVN